MMDEPRQGHRDIAPTLTASEVGQYRYCARAWWLRRVGGHAPGNPAVLARGRQRHAAHGHTLATSERRVALVRWLLVAALALAVVLILTLMPR